MPIEVAYSEALDYLYSFIDYSLTRNLRYTPDKFDLGRMVALLERLGNPHRQYPIIHVAGTKGKGSVSAMITSALKAAGYRVGFYSSPHLQEFTERIQMNGEAIPRQALVDLVEQLKPHVEVIQRLTTFELTTALGFMYFAQQGADVAVIEVGLGGRLDATNVVDPLLSVITSISYDHTKVLGDTLAAIASEKAGIIKAGKPLVVSPQKVEALQVIEQKAAELNAPLTLVGRDYFFAPHTHSLDGQTFFVWSADEQSLVNEFIELGGRQTWKPVHLFIPLLGYHQVENAATAYVALQVIRRNGLSISEAEIQQGFREVFWPGRFEVLRRNPPVIVDSAHNRDSALKLRLAMEDYLPGLPVVLLFGASEDKDIHGMYAELLPRVRQVIATESVHPRALGADQLVELAHQFGKPAQKVVPVEMALEKALELAGQEAAVVAAGSLFIAAAVRECWQKMGPPMPKFTVVKDN